MVKKVQELPSALKKQDSEVAAAAGVPEVHPPRQIWQGRRDQYKWELAEGARDTPGEKSGICAMCAQADLWWEVAKLQKTGLIGCEMLQGTETETGLCSHPPSMNPTDTLDAADPPKQGSSLCRKAVLSKANIHRGDRGILQLY